MKYFLHHAPESVDNLFKQGLQKSTINSVKIQLIDQGE